MNRKRIAAAVTAGGLAAGGFAATSLIGGSAAQALPSYQGSCGYDVRANTPGNGWLPVNSAVWVTNGSSPRRAIVHLTADAGVSSGAEIRVAYKVDSGPVQVYGPQNFANHTEYWQSRTNLAVIPVPAGTHRIQPYWRISGGAGSSGVIGARCLTAESQTS